MQEGHPLRADADEIKKAADRAVSLTRQLLAFSRRQVLEAKVVDLNAIIVNMDKLLRPLLREDIELQLNLQPGLGSIKADPGQIEQVVMNLAVNARDAMPGGGRLKIETTETDVEHRTDMKPGRYVVLSISDTGIGMSDVVRVHAFEPFFTTKETGKGTGLGLSTVYGIVKQSGGYIWVESEPNVGSVFKTYLPWLAAEPAEPAKVANVPRQRRR
jgi:signal transduction histidine kinase